MSSRYWYFGAIGILLVIYLFTLYLILNPNVSAAYFEYYISRESTLTIQERENMAPIEPGIYYSHDERKIGFDGWNAAEENYRWTQRRSAQLLFLLDDFEPEDLAGIIELRFHTAGRQRVSFALNGKTLYEGVFSTEDTEDNVLELKYPVSLLRQGVNELHFDLPDAVKPGIGNSQLIALALRSFAVR